MSSITQSDISAEVTLSGTKLELGDNTTYVNGITNDPKNNNEHLLTTGLALFNGLNIVQRQIDTLEQTQFILSNAAISQPIVSPVFEDDSYELSNWIKYSNSLLYMGDDKENYIRIPHVLFASNIHYLIGITISTIQSGTLICKNEDGETLGVMNKVGSYYFEVLGDSDTTIKFIADGVEYGQQIRVSSLALYKLSNPFYNFIYNKVMELANVDGGGYVDKVMFEHEMEVQKEAILAVCETINTDLLHHKEDLNNPHNVTLTQVGGAPAIHNHNDLYDTKEEVTTLIATAISGCATKFHTHDQYALKTDVTDTVDTAITTAIKSIPTISNLTILDGPCGILPEIYTHIGITSPSQLLITNNFYHNPNSAFDITSGYITANKVPINNTKLTDVICNFLTFGKLAQFDTKAIPTERKDKVIIHYQFHRNRKLIGYTVHGDVVNGYAEKWSLYTNFNTFIHTVDNSNGYIPDGFSISLPEPVECKSISLEVLQSTSDTLYINIEPRFADIEDGHVGITEELLLLSIPRDGNNMIYTLDLANVHDTTPIHSIENLPIYLYLSVNDDNTETLEYTYVTPEYGIKRYGIDVFTDNFFYGLDLSNTIYTDHLVHPIFGTWEVLVGINTINTIGDVFASTGCWESDPGVSIITFKFETKDIKYLVGYDLIWDKEKIDSLPTDWTLELHLSNGDNVIVDSVTMFESKLDFNQSTIKYTNTFNQTFEIDYFELHFQNTNNTGLHLVQFIPRWSYDFYHIPKNTMYNGNKSVSHLYLGTGIYKNNTFIIEQQTSLGTVCTLPINDLTLTQIGTEYKIINPFYTTDINCNVRVIEGDYSIAPICTVTDITDTTITVQAFSSHVFTINVMRNW